MSIESSGIKEAGILRQRDNSEHKLLCLFDLTFSSKLNLPVPAASAVDFLFETCWFLT